MVALVALDQLRFFVVGELEAWWIPYLFRSQPERAERYQVMFGDTHAFLPARNGIRLNTLHVTLHAATPTTLILLGALTAQQSWHKSFHEVVLG